MTATNICSNIGGFNNVASSLLTLVASSLTCGTYSNVVVAVNGLFRSKSTSLCSYSNN